MRKIEIQNGLLMLASFIGYFLLMKVLGLYHNMTLRVFNFVIHGLFVYLSVKSYYDDHEKYRFLPTFLAGMRTTAIAVAGFIIFQYIYLSQLNPDFMVHIQEKAIMGSYLNPATISIYLAMEGIAAGLFASYISMRIVGAHESTHAGV